MKIRTIVLTLLYTLAAADLYAQRADLLLFNNISYQPEAFYKTFGNDQPIYNGRLFQGYLPTITGTPYLDADQWATGIVFFDSIWYKNVQLKYDVMAGELIIETPNKMPVILPNSRLYAFSVGERKFIQLGTGNSKELPNGFYEILNEGKMMALALRKKIIKESTGQSRMEQEFNWDSRFYLCEEGLFYPITSKRNLYNILKEKKPSIHKALKRNGIRFRKNTEAAIKMAVQLYNQN